MKVREWYGQRKVEGDIGVEIEVEGVDLPEDVYLWDSEYDGSLRGECKEFVFSEPMPYQDYELALDNLQGAYEDCGTIVHDSARCGVHVHINVQELTFPQTYTFMTGFLILENVLTRWCGEGREGNLFCLRSQDAYTQVKVLRESVKSGNPRHLGKEDIRYCAMNTNSLEKFGSLEFRAMRGTADFSLLRFWVDALYKLRESTRELLHPIQLIESFSAGGGRDFMSRMLGEQGVELHKLYPDVEELLKQGVRNAQDLAYATQDWGRYDARLIDMRKKEAEERKKPAREGARPRWVLEEDLEEEEEELLAELGGIPQPRPLNMAEVALDWAEDPVPEELKKKLRQKREVEEFLATHKARMAMFKKGWDER